MGGELEIWGGRGRNWEVFGDGKKGVQTGKESRFMGFPFGVGGLVGRGVVD